MSDVYLSDAATHIPGCDANCFGAETCMGSAEPIPGRWVPWCVEHEEAWMTTADALDCRWHPQGAFIPDEGDTT